MAMPHCHPPNRQECLHHLFLSAFSTIAREVISEILPLIASLFTPALTVMAAILYLDVQLAPPGLQPLIDHPDFLSDKGEVTLVLKLIGQFSLLLLVH